MEYAHLVTLAPARLQTVRASAVTNPRALTGVLIYAALMVALVSSVGAPLVPTIAEVHHISLIDAQWMLTVTLIVGAVATPLLGRLGDGRERRYVLVGGLGVVTLGLLLASLSTSFVLLLIGRALQGVGMGLVPLCLAVARQFLPADTLPRAVSILSVTAATGVGLGYWLTGLIADAFDYRFAFAVTGVFALIATVLAAVVVPTAVPEKTVGVDWWGGLLLAVGLGSLLLALSEVDVWGWGSPAVISLLVTAVVLITTWIVVEHKVEHPLVQLRYFKVRNVLTANLAAIMLSFGMYIALTLGIRLVQTPPGAGYGFHVSASTTGLLIMPLSLATLASSRLAVLLSTRFGVATTMVTGALGTVAGLLVLAFAHQHLGEIGLSMGLLGIGVGMTYAAMPGLIIRAVPPEETGSATGMNQAARVVGGSFGSALGATLLAFGSTTANGAPVESRYTIALVTAACVCLLGAAVCTRARVS